MAKRIENVVGQYPSHHYFLAGQYPSHHYLLAVEKTEWFCIHCGKQEVWVEDNEGDYYVGPDYFCTACEKTFNMQDGGTNQRATGIIRQIRNGRGDEPQGEPGK